MVQPLCKLPSDAQDPPRTADGAPGCGGVQPLHHQACIYGPLWYHQQEDHSRSAGRCASAVSFGCCSGVQLEGSTACSLSLAWLAKLVTSAHHPIKVSPGKGSWSACVAGLLGGLTLEQAVDQKRLFWQDYHTVIAKDIAPKVSALYAIRLTQDPSVQVQARPRACRPVPCMSPGDDSPACAGDSWDPVCRTRRLLQGVSLSLHAVKHVVHAVTACPAPVTQKACAVSGARRDV